MPNEDLNFPKGHAVEKDMAKYTAKTKDRTIAFLACGGMLAIMFAVLYGAYALASDVGRDVVHCIKNC